MTKTVASLASSPRLEDLYTSFTEFESILRDALSAARTAFEVELCQQVSANYKDFRGRMYWNDHKDQLLRSIAGPAD